MKKNLATAVVTLVGADAAQNVLSTICSIASEPLQTLIAEIAAGIVTIPEEFPTKKDVPNYGICTLEYIKIDNAEVHFSYASTVVRYFKTAEEAAAATSRWDGSRERNDEHPYATSIVYKESGCMPIKHWLVCLDAE